MSQEKVIHVWTSFTVVGFHNWPDAPVEVSYLKNEHRHLFKFSVALKVEGLDRSQEFHTLKTKVLRVLRMIYSSKLGVVEEGEALDFKNDSCETIASNVLDMLKKIFNTSIIVEVSEDDENGAIVECS